MDKPKSVVKTRKSTGRDSDRAKAYAVRRFLNPTETKAKSKLACGYASSINPYQIEKQPGFKNQIEELKHLARLNGCAPEDQLMFFKNMRDDSKISPTARIESGKEINKMVGYHAPTQVEVESQVTQNVSVLVGMLRLGGASVGDLITNARQNTIQQNVQQYANDNDTQ